MSHCIKSKKNHKTPAIPQPPSGLKKIHNIFSTNINSYLCKMPHCFFLHVLRCAIQPYLHYNCQAKKEYQSENSNNNTTKHEMGKETRIIRSCNTVVYNCGWNCRNGGIKLFVITINFLKSIKEFFDSKKLLN